MSRGNHGLFNANILMDTQTTAYDPKDLVLYDHLNRITYSHFYRNNIGIIVDYIPPKEPGTFIYKIYTKSGEHVVDLYLINYVADDFVNYEYTLGRYYIYTKNLIVPYYTVYWTNLEGKKVRYFRYATFLQGDYYGSADYDKNYMIPQENIQFGEISEGYNKITIIKTPQLEEGSLKAGNTLTYNIRGSYSSTSYITGSFGLTLTDREDI